MGLKDEIRKKLKESDIDSALESMEKALPSSSGKRKILAVTQSRYEKLKQDSLAGILYREEYEVQLNKVRHNLVELLDTMSDDSNNQKSRLEQVIRNLDIERERIGQLYMVNCNRLELVDYFWDRFDEKMDSKAKFYFVPACPLQMPPSFAERMVWEVLMEELDEEAGSLCVERSSNGLRLQMADFNVKNNLARTKKAFKKYFCKRFQENDFEKLLLETIPQQEYHYVATIIKIELKEWKSFMPEFLEWILDTFANDKEDHGVSYLFFTVIYMDNYVEEPLDDQQRRILTALRSTISDNEDSCTVIKGFTPVKKMELEYWFREIGERNPNQIEESIQALVEGLPSEKRSTYNKEQVLDMADIEALQKIVYEISNE